MRVRRRTATVAMMALVVGGLILPTMAGAKPRRVSLTNSRAPFARPANLVRWTQPGRRLTFQVYLGLRDRAGAEALLKRVSNPTSSSYGRYLGARAFTARFGRSASDVAEVTAWLSRRGLSIRSVPASRLWVEARGTAGQIGRTFGVRMGAFRSTFGVVRAADRAPSIPSALSGVVRGVNLESIRMKTDTPPPPPAYRAAKPCNETWAQKIATNKPKAYGDHWPLAPCGYTPRQMQGAYGMRSSITGGIDGSGVTVAVLDAYGLPTMQSDLDTYSSKHGLPQLTITQIIDPPDRGSNGLQQGWWGEEALDVEAVHTMAPGADIVFRGAANSTDDAFQVAMADLVDNHRADIITNSWGALGEALPASRIDAWHDLFLEAGATGIGVYFSSGDCGDDKDPQGACGGAGYRTTEHPAADPLVTAVGGTSLGVGPLNDRVLELGWGSTSSDLIGGRWRPNPPGYFVYGGGGGTSRIFAEPGYQSSVVPNKLAAWWGGSNRVVPDVAAVGDPNTGFLEGITQRFPNGVHYGEYRIGGTSLSSPLFAGMMALADDAAGMAHGFANPALYALAGTSAFHDIVSPAHPQAVVRANYANGVNKKDGVYFALRTMNQTGTLHTRPGYDDVTGNGTPNGSHFLSGLS
jgi:subtilase family serine protease